MSKPDTKYLEQFFQKEMKVKQSQNSLDNFNQWVAAKTLLALNTMQNNVSNVIALRPKATPQLDLQDKYNQKPSPKFSFFTPYNIKPNSPIFALNNQKPEQQNRNIDDQIKEKQKQDMQLKPNLSCNNCGETDHNSMSCLKPPKRGRGR